MAAASMIAVNGIETIMRTKIIAIIAGGVLASHGMLPSVEPRPANV